MWLGEGVEFHWYIGLLTILDMTQVPDNATFQYLLDNPDIFTEMRDYSRVDSDDSVHSGQRVIYKPDNYTLQTVNNQLTSFVDDDNLMRIQSTSDISQMIVGMFLCNRVFNDDIDCNVYSIGNIVPATIIYPNQIIEVNYTPVYQ